MVADVVAYHFTNPLMRPLKVPDNRIHCHSSKSKSLCDRFNWRFWRILLDSSVSLRG
jgi:hypothetical protein